MKRLFAGLGWRSHDQEDEDVYGVQSRPRLPQPSRRQEYYRDRQPRFQTSETETNDLRFDVLPYDHSPEGSPETRHSRTDTGNDTASLHKDRPFYDQARNVRGKSIPEEINRSAVRQMKQNYEEEIRNFQIAKQNQSKRLEDIKQQYEGKMRSLQDKVYRLQLEKFDMRSQPVNVKKEPEHMKYLNLQLTESRKSPEQKVDDYSTQLQPCCYRLQQYQKDLKDALEQKQEDTHIKTQLQTELKQKKDVNNSLQKDKECLNALITELENDNYQLTRQVKQHRLQTEQLQKEGAKRMRNDITILQNKLLHSEQALTDTKTLLQETEFRLQQIQQEKQSLEACYADQDIMQTENDRMKKEINDLQEALDREQKSKHKLSDDYNAIQQRFREVNHEYDKTKTRLQQYQEQINSLQEEKARTQKSLDSQWSKESDALKTENGKLSAEKDRLNEECVRLQYQVAELRYELIQLQADNDQLKKQMKDYAALKNKLVNTEQELNTTKLELKETNDRSNTCLGDQETKDSPNIVELSDMNRPSKLADRYKELYDNQWTDAYEILEDSVETEEQIISILLDILIETKRFCDHQTEMEMNHVLRVVTRKDSMLQSDVPVSVIKYIKSCRKSTVAETMKVKYKEYVDELRKSPLFFVKHALRVDAFLLECFKVCWLMAIQDPPVVLAPVLKHGDAFKTDLYSPYTVCGKIVDYVVWPALLLHTNGPTLTKGVAQGMKKR